MRCGPCWMGVLFGAGMALLILAITLRLPIQNAVDNIIRRQVMLTPASVTYDGWRLPPVPVYDDIYLFNISNPLEFNSGQKPQLQLVGPFVYSKIQEKQGANFTGDLHYAMYYDYAYFIYEEEITRSRNTRSTLNDTIFIPNLPLLTVISQIDHNTQISSFIKEILEKVVDVYEESHGKDALTLNGSIHDILWGLEDPIMKELYKVKLAPSPFLALQVNGSTDPDALTRPTVVYTGHKDIARVDQYKLFHGRNSTGCWANEAANVINGTEGSMFEPLFVYDKSRKATIYNDELFRSVELAYVNETKYEDILCYIYKIPDWALQNVTNNPANEAYYAYKYSGMLNLTACASNVPLYISKMLFLDADPRLLDNITLDTHADPSLHDTYLCIEPYTGVVMDGHKRVQINVEIKDASSGILSKVQPAFVPLITVDEHGSITRDLAGQLRSELLTPLQLLHLSFYFVCGLGSCLLIGSGLIAARLTITAVRNRGKERKEDKEVLVDAEEIPDISEQSVTGGGVKGRLVVALLDH